ncbi:MAG TPA: OmpH family outer membrane protein [Candidatus Cloacimonadota bacterium]|nr:OmpH family outer membrane protein [Candidatus Cloacimonadota bacterium]
MKRIIFLLIMLAAMTLATAQQLKIAYVNTDQILSGSNEAAEIARIYDMERTGWMNQIKAMREDIQQMERNYEIDKLTKNEAAKKAAQDKIDAKKAEAGQKLEEYFGDGGKAEQRYKELIEPLTQKITTVIKKIAEEENYSLVLDVSMGTVLYALPSMDITDRVLTELNKNTQKPSAETSAGAEVSPKEQTLPKPSLKPNEKEEVFGPKK